MYVTIEENYLPLRGLTVGPFGVLTIRSGYLITNITQIITIIFYLLPYQLAKI
jgi:hypothetical protein